MEEVGKRLKGCIKDRGRGFTSWVRLGDLSLQYLLFGVEACELENKNDGWFRGWEEKGRQYKMV